LEKSRSPPHSGFLKSKESWYFCFSAKIICTNICHSPSVYPARFLKAET
jgi:hypothetical protein